jgi:hypothetical protein
MINTDTVKIIYYDILSMFQYPKFPITKDAVKIFFQGAIGAMTFGAYHLYITTQMIETNNKINEDKINKQKNNLNKHKNIIDTQQKELNKQHEELILLLKRIETIEKRRFIW